MQNIQKLAQQYPALSPVIAFGKAVALLHAVRKFLCPVTVKLEGVLIEAIQGNACLSQPK